MPIDHRYTPDETYNTATPGSWSRAWQGDPMGGELSEEWDRLIAAFRAKAPLGSLAPDFEQELLGGGTWRLSDHHGKKSVLIVFGCYACPPCVTNIRTSEPSLVSLYETFRNDIEFCYLYTREAHPGQNIVPHESMDDKRRLAQRLQDEERLTFPLVIDDIEGSTQRAYVDPHFNNPVFLVNRAGVISYKSAWLDSSELPQVLEDQVLWDARSQTDRTIKKTFSERIRPLREPFDTNCNARIKRLMGEIGLEQAAMGAIPGIESDKA